MLDEQKKVEAPEEGNLESFLDEISENNKGPVFDDARLESEPSQDEKVETPAEEDKPTGEQLPFHKHPRFKNLTNENRDLKEKMLKLEGKLEERISNNQPITDSDIPPWLKTLMGDDTELYNQFQDYQNGVVDTVLAKVQEQQTTQKETDSAETAKFKKWVDDEFEALTDDGLKFNQDEVSKIALDLQPTDDDGNISIRKAYDIWKDQQELAQLRKKDPTKVQVKKELAAKTAASGGGSAPTSKKVLTPEDLRGKTMQDLVSM